MLAHGGMLTQIQQTKAALETLGHSVEYLRWWDESQKGEIVHYFGRMAPHLIELAHQKGVRVVLSELLAVQGSRSSGELWRQRTVMRVLERILPHSFASSFRWEAHRKADACIALTAWEAHLMQYLFGAPNARVHVVPNGVESEFLESAPRERGKWLVCTATITQRKRVLELAKAAAVAQTPLWVVGKPYSESDPYFCEFRELVDSNRNFVRFEGPIQERGELAKVYREARGFVLWSSSESLSLSALEAAACKCPLLLSELPWATSVFGVNARYCPISYSSERAAEVLRAFYDAAPQVAPPPSPCTWEDVARQLVAVYTAILQPARNGKCGV